MSAVPPPVSDQPVLKLLNVESSYGPIKAIRGVSLQVRRSEIATVLGSNGAGKSTILKTISGIIDPRKGSIDFKGEDITAQDPAHIVQLGSGDLFFTETGTNSITNGESPSRRLRRGSPTPVTSRPSSSLSSRFAASSSVSPGSSLPPGNSQHPPCRLCRGRRQSR